MKRKPSDIDTNPADHLHYASTMDALRKIFKDEGLMGLYNGMASSLLGVASTNFAYFYWYTVVRTFYLTYSKNTTGAPSTAIELGLGAAAGALAQLFTIPVAVITTRQQTQSKGERKGFFDTGREVVNGEDGWQGLWRGINASLVLVVNPAITYGAYQRLKDGIFPGKVNLKPWEAFSKSPPPRMSSCEELLLTLHTVLGAMSKALATIATQPLIVAKVGLQSKPPPARNGKPFKSFGEVMSFIVEHEGFLGLFKGIAPQILKGLFVQGILMMTKERMELSFILLFRYVRKVRQEKLQKLVDMAAEKAGQAAPVLTERAKQAAPALLK